MGQADSTNFVGGLREVVTLISGVWIHIWNVHSLLLNSKWRMGLDFCFGM